VPPLRGAIAAVGGVVLDVVCGGVQALAKTTIDRHRRAARSAFTYQCSNIE
jgi:hypothetical protein